MCQDETRLGLKTIAGRWYCSPIVKPVGLSRVLCNNFYLYGVVEPLTGYNFFFYSSLTLMAIVFQKFFRVVGGFAERCCSCPGFDQRGRSISESARLPGKYYSILFNRHTLSAIEEV